MHNISRNDDFRNLSVFQVQLLHYIIFHIKVKITSKATSAVCGHYKGLGPMMISQIHLLDRRLYLQNLG